VPTRSPKVEASQAAQADSDQAVTLAGASVRKLDSRQQPLQAYFFRVSGTNRTLNTRVVFTGNLLTATNLALSLPAQPDSNLQKGTQLFQFAPSGSAAVPLPKARISGKAVIGSNAAIEINAVPAKP
jgi:hypothetical protein